MSSHDVIDQLVGIATSSPLGQIRDERPQARANAQASYAALFEPTHPGEVTALERFAIATFVAGLHRAPALRDFYAERLAGLAGGEPALAAVAAETERGLTEGPYGAFPAGPLSAEDRPGLALRPSAEARQALGERLAAALAHAHLLVFRPRDASPAALQDLLDAGWSTTDIVTLSQLVAFLAFQIRTVAGLRVLAATPAA